ncbi:MAG: hypothetical protein IPJ51_06320 [Saprospiraceae bacterium]|jgi:hypothetical protein|nr:hypothetical protein [Saprospiraceae bacterium]
MIMIFTKNSENSVNHVIDWLIHLNARYIRVTEFDSIKINEIEINNENIDFNFEINSLNLKYSEINSVWFRHIGNLKLDVEYSSPKKELQGFLKSEFNSLKQFFIWALEQKKCLGSFHNQNINKLITLNIAANLGMKIPPTLITRDGKSINKNFGKVNVVTKSISELLINYTEKYAKVNYTVEIKKDDYHKINALSLIQENIFPAISVRVFYIGSKYYACEIHSSDMFSKDDSRLFTNKRLIPIKLPDYIIEQIISLSNAIKLKTGSIDFLYSINDMNYYFLEINPVGQFGFISYQFNGEIDYEIAKYLSS